MKHNEIYNQMKPTIFNDTELIMCEIDFPMMDA